VGALGGVRSAWRSQPALVVLAAMLAFAFVLGVLEGLHAVGQTTVNGLISGSYFALGAAGLTLVYGVLKLIHFAHGDFLTFGAYVAFVVTGGVLDLPIVVATLVAVAATAALGLALEGIMWRPMRRRGAGMFQLVLMALGLAFVIRNTIQLVAGSEQRSLGLNVTDSFELAGLRIGRTELAVVTVGFSVLLTLGVMLKFSSLGKQIRALSDNPELAETTGIDTGRIIIITWVLAGGLAGLAGVLYAGALGSMNPNLGFAIVLSLFAAVIVGGIGNAYGALAGGVLIGVIQEWSTLVVDASLKVAVGFGVLIAVLILRPQGIFGGARTADR
jgi:neutral amino acid transport system permease protein